jgi:hypothetical protein
MGRIFKEEGRAGRRGAVILSDSPTGSRIMAGSPIAKWGGSKEPVKVANQSSDRIQTGGGVLRDLDAEFILQGHEKFDGLQIVHVEIGDKRGRGLDGGERQSSLITDQVGDEGGERLEVRRKTKARPMRGGIAEMDAAWSAALEPMALEPGD